MQTVNGRPIGSELQVNNPVKSPHHFESHPIRIYGLRFKIEHTFKQADNVIGAFSYHFWMMDMKPTRRRSDNKYLPRESAQYRQQVKRKVQACYVFIQACHIAQGLAPYLSTAFPALVWASFGSWLRTIRAEIPPSE